MVLKKFSANIVTLCTCIPKFSMWLPFDQLALSCQDQVCVRRLDGNSFWSGLLNSVPLTVKAPKFCLVRKLMGARSKPKRTSFVKLEVGLQCQAVEKKFSLSL